MPQDLREVVPGVDRELLDKAIRNIINTQAGIRSSKTPVTIRNAYKDRDIYKMMLQMREKGMNVRLNPPAEEGPASGSYNPRTDKAEIELYGENPTYKDFAHSLGHEGIHAWLDKHGYNYPQIPYSAIPLFQKLILGFTGKPDMHTQAMNALVSAGRSPGRSWVNEVPAYMGSFDYSGEEAPGITPEFRNKYISQFEESVIKPEHLQKWQNMLRGIEASQRVR